MEEFVSRLNVIGFPRNGSVSAAYEKAPGGQHAAKRVDSVVAGWLLLAIGILIGGGILGSHQCLSLAPASFCLLSASSAAVRMALAMTFELANRLVGRFGQCALGLPSALAQRDLHGK